jgi:hypothetical protein
VTLCTNQGPGLAPQDNLADWAASTEPMGLIKSSPAVIEMTALDNRCLTMPHAG